MAEAAERHARDLRETVFGVFDGMCSSLGVVVASVAAGIAHVVLVAAVLGGAFGAAASMGGGEWLSDARASKHGALVMGAAALVGSLIPAAPFFLGLSGFAGTVIAIGLVLAVAVAIAEIRPEERSVSYIKTYGVLLAVLAAVIPLSIVLHLAA